MSEETKDKIVKILKNILVFTAPDLIVFLGALAAKFSADGVIVAVLLTNILIDVIKKFVVEGK